VLQNSRGFRNTLFGAHCQTAGRRSSRGPSPALPYPMTGVPALVSIPRLPLTLGFFGY